MIGQREYQWDNDSLKWDDVDSFNIQYNAQNLLTNYNYLVHDTSIAGPWKRFIVGTWTHDANEWLQVRVDTSPTPIYGYPYGTRQEFTYNANGLELLRNHKLWNQTNNNWGNYRKYSTSYTAFNKILVALEEGWAINNVWINSGRIVYTYNPQNLDSTRSIEFWNSANSQWVPDGLTTYAYDASGNQTFILQQTYDTTYSVYKNTKKFEYTYDANNRLTGYIESEWFSNMNIWRNKYKYTYTYNAQGMQETRLYERWNLNTLTWDLWGRNTYTYDANNRPVTDLGEEHYSNNAWTNNMLSTYTRNASGYRTSWLWEGWNSNTLAWKNIGRWDYWYENKSSVGVNEIAGDKLFVYPNPAGSPVVFVNAESNLAYTVYDLTGRLVTQGKLQQGTNSIILNEPAGVYLLKAGNTATRIVRQ